MYLQLALSVLLALTGLAGPVEGAKQLAPDRVVGQAAADASPGGTSLEKIAIVVPPVAASGTVVAQSVPQAAAVVADQLVTPKRLQSAVVEAKDFQTLGVTWPEGAQVSDLGAEVRTRADGTWSPWVGLAPADAGPDAGSADAARAVRGGTDPLWVGDADAVQLSFAASTAGGPKGLTLALVDAAAKPASTAVASSSANGAATIRTAAYSTTALQTAVGAPPVISRAQWGAQPEACVPDVASKLVGAVLHHTAGSNDYSTVAQAEAQIRGDQAYHFSLGWCDIGYNFIVDKWGNIYEGRANSMSQAVIGVHAGGFNTGTVGVAMLGTYDAAPSAATQQAVAQIIGYRLAAYGVDGRGSMSYTTGVGENSKFKNQTVTLPRIFGHRDVAYTACPGNGGYAALPNIRAMSYDAGYADRFAKAAPVVKAMYADLLLRDVDPAGLQAWSGMLAGGASQGALVSSLTASDEYLSLRVRQAYNQVLGREPEAGAVSAWITEIRAGRATADDVKRRFYDTPEYYNLSGGTPAGYIGLLYQTAFQRSASAAEVAYWSGMIPVIGRGAVVDGIWLSLEAARYRAGQYYVTFLRRAADPGGQDYWGHVLLASGEGAVRIGIAGSDEYRALAVTRYPY